MNGSIFVDLNLKPIMIKADGKTVNRFRVISKENDDNREAIKKARRTDGLCVLVTISMGEKEG
jgi:negative regulator of sigma E activity